jgi:hypothetical protein
MEKLNFGEIYLGSVNSWILSIGAISRKGHDSKTKRVIRHYSFLCNSILSHVCFNLKTMTSGNGEIEIFNFNELYASTHNEQPTDLNGDNKGLFEGALRIYKVLFEIFNSYLNIEGNLYVNYSFDDHSFPQNGGLRLFLSNINTCKEYKYYELSKKIISEKVIEKDLVKGISINEEELQQSFLLSKISELLKSNKREFLDDFYPTINELKEFLKQAKKDDISENLMNVLSENKKSIINELNENHNQVLNKKDVLSKELKEINITDKYIDFLSRNIFFELKSIKFKIDSFDVQTFRNFKANKIENRQNILLKLWIFIYGLLLALTIEAFWIIPPIVFMFFAKAFESAMQFNYHAYFWLSTFSAICGVLSILFNYSLRIYFYKLKYRAFKNVNKTG